MAEVNDIPRLSRLALFFSHPYWLVVVAGMGALIAIGYAQAARLNGDQIWASVFISLVIGVPAVFWTKHLIRSDIESYAEFSLGIASRAMRRRFWKAHRKSVLSVTPILLSFAAAAVLARYLGLPYMPILGMLIMLSILGYPEQEEVYRTAKAKLSGPDVKASG